MFSRSFFQRPAPYAQSRSSRRRRRKTQQQVRLRNTRLESLEDRRVLAVLYVANDSGFTVTNDTAPPGLSAGDTVTWNGGGQFSAAQNLTFGTNAFDSVNAAIAAANSGDTIDVAPGTYSEQVNTNKSITLLGAQHGVDAQGGRASASESILDATNNAGKTQFYVTADDVTIDGFTVQNETNTNVFGAAILIQPGHHGTHVVNDIVQNNQIGLYLANDSTTDQAVIQHDLFQNNNQTGPGAGTAIYTDQFVAGGAVTDVLIDANKIAGNNNAGIALSGTDPTKPASHITISNNVIDSNGRGIYAYATTSSTITGNDITNSTTPTDGGTSVAIGLFGSDNGITISGNKIENGALRGIRILTDTSTPGITANQNVTVNDNAIFGFSGGNVVVESGGYTGTLDASKNWWGTNNATTIQSDISGSNVAFSPYLDTGSNSVSSGPGFQGDLTHLDVAGNGQGTVGPIEQAILATPAGGTVTIQAGTYVEGDVVINKNITLQGAGNAILQAPSNGSGAGITITGNPQTVTIANLSVVRFANSIYATFNGGTLNLTDVTLNSDTHGDVYPPASVSGVNQLNIASTSSSPQTVTIAPAVSGFGTVVPPATPPVAGGLIQFSGQDAFSFGSVGGVTVSTGSGADTFNVTASSDTPITIDAGDPAPPAKPGDTLNMNLSGTTGASLSVTNDASGFSGAWTFTNAKPVNFSDIETLSPSTASGQGNSTLTATEGVATGNVVVATFTDPASGFSLSDYSADINWGDGTSSTGTVTYDATSKVYSVTGNHTYAEVPEIGGPGPVAAITVTVHRTGSSDLTLSSVPTVVEPALMGTGTTLTGNEYTALSNVTVATFTHGNDTEDPNTFGATIDWGDGTSSVGKISLANGTYSVTGSHTYTDEGTFAVTTSVTDFHFPPVNGQPQPQVVFAEFDPVVVKSTATIAEELTPNGQPGTADQRIVAEAFRDLLHRAVDTDGLAYWSGKLDGGMTRAAFIADIQNSDEYLGDQVDALYVKYLHRHADPGGLANGIKLLSQGETPEQLAAMLANSDEYLALHAGGNDAFLSALFSDALGRPIDAAAKTHFDTELSAGATHAQIADEIFASAEYRTDVVRDLYMLALDRTPDSSGSSYFADQLAHGKTDDQVLAEIMNSSEYLDRISPST